MTKFTTNNKWRLLINWQDLTVGEQEEFDWINTEEKQSDASFFRYRKNVYCLDMFMLFGKDQMNIAKGWQAYHSDSYFSGIVIKINPDDNEEIMIGTFFS